MELGEVVVGGLVGGAVRFLMPGDGIAGVGKLHGMLQVGELAMIETGTGAEMLSQAIEFGLFPQDVFLQQIKVSVPNGTSLRGSTRLDEAEGEVVEGLKVQDQKSSRSSVCEQSSHVTGSYFGLSDLRPSDRGNRLKKRHSCLSL